MGNINKLGTQVRLADGREGTVVYNSLCGVGIKWGLHNPDPKDFEGTCGNTVSSVVPEGFRWQPDALLRDPWCGPTFMEMECVGEDYEIVRVGLGGEKEGGQ